MSLTDAAMSLTDVIGTALVLAALIGILALALAKK